MAASLASTPEMADPVTTQAATAAPRRRRRDRRPPPRSFGGGFPARLRSGRDQRARRRVPVHRPHVVRPRRRWAARRDRRPPRRQRAGDRLRAPRRGRRRPVGPAAGDDRRRSRSRPRARARRDRRALRSPAAGRARRRRVRDHDGDELLRPGIRRPPSRARRPAERPAGERARPGDGGRALRRRLGACRAAPDGAPDQRILRAERGVVLLLGADAGRSSTRRDDRLGC